MNFDMDFNSYIESLPDTLSKVKRLIIKTLIDAPGDFPKAWVPSSTLLNLTGQKYFDRRIRELKDQTGCDIETSFHNGEHSYRLHSLELINYNPRLYLSQSQKGKLFKSADYTCQICGRKVLPGLQGLQADHKIPLIKKPLKKEEIGDPAHWQAVCNECNVRKRRACAECEEDCNNCPWAFPENCGVLIPLRLPTDIVKELSCRGIKGQSELEQLITTTLKKYLSLSDS